jgi:hypothetical protein
MGVSDNFPSDDANSAFYYLYENQIKVWPSSAGASSVDMEYRVGAKAVDYDVGSGDFVDSNGNSTLSNISPSKNWPVNFWDTAIVDGVSYPVTANTATGATLTGNLGTVTKEFEIYLATLIPEDFHDLIVQFATIKALRSLGKAEEAVAVERDYKQSIASLGGK